ncbi:hypothetical protein [Peribacillus frigoritolerans]|uniref:hypothetical protein n=1 Tax=Peribacillus frigoritolerans TaxID=450367 RepID=UPI00164DC3FB|nr:hypothetical protein [Peribacillus frigoritolerans]MDG4850120.1 hypothetical protein [Peribacillus frigoritolerans]QNK46969.1 hypothetical protein H7F28_16625 [Brevibacterium sp. PAMC23299]
MKKKSLFSILIISLLVFSHVPNTLAEEKNETIPSSTVNPIVEVKLISDDVIQIQPTASIIEMSKPIAHQAKLTNTQLGKMVKAQKGTTWLSIVSTLVFAGGPTAPAGVATALASALAGSPNSLIAAYYSGKHAYHVSVYASGKKPSLSKITYIYYTKSNLSLRIPR